jgi:hypothetical protein
MRDKPADVVETCRADYHGQAIRNGASHPYRRGMPMPTVKTMAVKTMATTALALLVLATGPAIAQKKADADVVREARDRDEIEHLAWRYARALDTFDAEAYAATYTPDGSFGPTKGREALVKMIAAFRRDAKPGERLRSPLLHMETNHWIEFKDKDNAVFHYYWITIGTPQKQGDPTTVLAAGNGIDEVVRLNGQWLFKSRSIAAPND